MKKIFLGLVILLSLSCKNKNTEFKDGDIILHTSRSSQSSMVQNITSSNLTHCGVIFKKNNNFFVLEAINPVSIIPLDKWIKRGKNSKYKVIRVKKELNTQDKKIMFNYAKKQLGKSYDSKFQWSDNKMYCSELVWKIYNSIGINLCQPHSFSDYNLNTKEIKKIINQRYKTQINMNEKVVTPVDLYNSNIVELVFDNY